MRGLLRRLLGGEELPSAARLEELMACYRVERLAGVDPAAFRARIEGFLGTDDHRMEGWESPEGQRDMSIRFHWGHDHDFGTFSLPGMMGSRHVTLLASFMDRLAGLPGSLEGRRVLDIGCWTGGTSLLLAALGARVTAIEEVKKYAECVGYLASAFGIADRLEVRPISLYDCTAPDLQDAFDFVLFAGVLYHVTDPVLALRITFNCLANGGTCLLETAMHRAGGGAVLAYEGPRVFAGGSADDKSRRGWNWFMPTPEALVRMMEDVGYSGVRTAEAPGERLLAVGRRERHAPMLRAGLSRRDVR